MKMATFVQTVLPAHHMRRRMKHAQNVRLELTNLCKDKQDVFPAAQTSPQPSMEQWKNQTVLLIVQLVHTAQRTERALSVRLACTNHPEESQLVFLAAKT